MLFFISDKSSSNPLLFSWKFEFSNEILHAKYSLFYWPLENSYWFQSLWLYCQSQQSNWLSLVRSQSCDSSYHCRPENFQSFMPKQGDKAQQISWKCYKTINKASAKLKNSGFFITATLLVNAFGSPNSLWKTLRKYYIVINVCACNLYNFIYCTYYKNRFVLYCRLKVFNLQLFSVPNILHTFDNRTLCSLRATKDLTMTWHRLHMGWFRNQVAWY